jgi:protocatechuate 3,4-dioxygenase beta subunit
VRHQRDHLEEVECMDRRRFHTVSIAGAAVAPLGSAAPVVARALAPTPACGARTPRQTAGPFFTPGSPARASLLEPGLTGDRMVLTGRVLSTRCAPVAGALLDVWQADGAGEYDLGGFRLRGHLWTDEAGAYRLETIVPGGYGPRTRHLHLTVGAPRGPVLTTQLYFPDEPANRRDPIFHPALVVRVDERGTVLRASFDFVVDSPV